MKLDKNKNILIVGLGLLGGSYARALTDKGYKVWAIEKNPASVEYAKVNAIVADAATEEDPNFIARADLVIFALYPHIFLEWVERNAPYFKAGAVLTDVTGVKCGIVERVQSTLPDTVEFISAHPMAGREVSGVENSDPAIFKNANYIVVPTERNTPDAIALCEELGRELGFHKIATLSVSQHDEMIAFLSQLTHCIAVSLMCANEAEGLENYTGDSFRDLTRIARINDEMWSELFLLNREALLKEMDRFRDSFDELYKSIEDNDREKMRAMMRLSTQRRSRFDKVKEN